jgi:polyisoprenoid-binding protein YceI
MANTIEQPTVGTKTIWTLDPSHSQVTFSAKHMMVTTVRGTFGEVTGKVDLDEKDFTNSQVEATIDIAGLTSRDEKRDAHLRSADFFDAENHPELRFESKRIEALDDETLRIVGELTMNGVTRELELRAEIIGAGRGAADEERVGLEVTGQLSRRDYGIRFNAALGSGNAVVADKVRLELDIAAVKQG